MAEWSGRHAGKEALRERIWAFEAIETHTPYPQPSGILWDAVRDDQFDSIPILRKLRT